MLEGLPDFPFRNLERLCLVHGLLPFPVGQWPRPNNAAPSLQPITEPSSLRRAAPPLRSASVLSPSRLEPLVACPLPSENRFSRSIRKPGRASRRLHAGSRLGSLRTSPQLIPEEWPPPGFGLA